MFTARSPHRWVVPLMIVSLLALVLVACSAQAEAPGQAGVEEPAASAPAGQDKPAEGSGGNGSDQPGGLAAPVEQRIVKTGEVGLEVDNVAVILAQVRAMAVEMGGYVGGSQAGTSDQTASVTLRVPADRFDELITRLQELADVEVVSMSTREEDVTGQIVDLAARVRNLEAQLQAVEGQAALSTLTVTIIPRDEPVADVQAGWDPGAQAKNAVATLVG